MADTREPFEDIAIQYGYDRRTSQKTVEIRISDLEALMASRETEARLDEVEKIPVIETTGVGYEVIVSHRLERRRQLYNERDRIAALTAQEKLLQGDSESRSGDLEPLSNQVMPEAPASRKEEQ
jgi:hypothetical protein